jgi:hypothetical protein
VTALRFLDDEGTEVGLDGSESDALLALTGGLEAATVSACPACAARVLAVVAFVDLLGVSGPHPRSEELVDLADESPTLHLYVVDDDSECTHSEWRDPGHGEWEDAVEEPGPRLRP